MEGLVAGGHGPRFLSIWFLTLSKNAVHACMYTIHAISHKGMTLCYACMHIYMRIHVNAQARAFPHLHIRTYGHAQSHTCTAYGFALPWHALLPRYKVCSTGADRASEMWLEDSKHPRIHPNPKYRQADERWDLSKPSSIGSAE